jgi:hypothetical protein
VHVLALEVAIRIPSARSRKDRRQVVRSLVEAPRRRFGVAAADVGEADVGQAGPHRGAVLGYAAVSSSPAQAEAVIDSVEAFVWSHPDIEVVDARRRWLPEEG